MTQASAGTWARRWSVSGSTKCPHLYHQNTKLDSTEFTPRAGRGIQESGAQSSDMELRTNIAICGLCGGHGGNRLGASLWRPSQ